MRRNFQPAGIALLALLSAAARAEHAPAKEPARPVVVEKTIYVPYEQLEAVFEKEGRGIFLPYQEFLRLWEAAQPKPLQPKPDVPPAAAVIRSASYAGAVQGDSARFTLALEIESLKAGWSELDLPFKGIAMESVEISNPRALFTAKPPAGEGGYAILLPEPGRYSVKIQLSARVAQEPGKKAVSFGIPPAAISRLDLTIPEEDIRVEVAPALAVTQTAAKQKATQVLAFLGNSGEVSVSWMPPPGKTSDAGAVLFAEQSIRVHLGERILKITSDIDYRVLRGSADALRVRMPEGTRLISVKGDNIREWVPEGDSLVVRLHAPLRDGPRGDGADPRPAYRLSLSFERILPETPPTLAVPFPRVEEVLRESGWAVLDHESGLTVRVASATGLSQLDPAEIPEPLRAGSGGPLFGFRYLAQPLALELQVEKITPAIRSFTTSVVTLGREEDVWIGWIDYAIAKAGVFRLEIKVPSRWNADSIGEPAAVDDFQTADADGVRTITVSLKSKALGTFRLPFRLTAPGSAVAGEAAHSPPAIAASIEDRGIFGVSVPRAFEATSIERTRMTSADVDELFRSGIMTQIGADAGIPLAYGYREQPASVRHRITARKTEVDVLAQHLLEISDGGIKLTHILDFEVLYAAADRLAFSAPSSLDDLLKVEAKEKKEVRKASSAQGRTLWEVILQAPTLGAVSVTVSHEVDLKALEAGRPFPYVVPIIHGSEVRAEKGFVALRKEGTLEIAPQQTAMEAIDAADLPDKLRRGQIYGAFRYFAPDPSLTLTLTRYEYQPLATTVINLIRLESILSEERRLKTRATLLVQNTERQYLELGLAPEAILSLSVAGKAQQPRKRRAGAGTLVQIPSSAGAAGTFPIVIVYDEPLASSAMGTAGAIGVRTLEVLEKVPVGKVELDLYLPPQYAYMAWSGTLKEHAPGAPALWSRFKDLVNAVAGKGEGVAPVQAAAPPAPMPAPAPGAGAIDIDLETQARGLTLRHFDTLAPVGDLHFYYVGRMAFAALDFLAFAAAAVAAWLLLTRFHWHPLQTAALLVAAPLVLAWFTRGPIAEVFTSLLAGGAAAMLVVGTAALIRFARGRRAARIALAPDPFLEEAPAPKRETPKAKPPGPAGPPAKGGADEV